ncbi:MAG: hypothetical protein MRY83_01570 [Flavobacteriales bacterium]|nr:hypothetical protein [Flavobacteriales bacterium]
MKKDMLNIKTISLFALCLILSLVEVQAQRPGKNGIYSPSRESKASGLDASPMSSKRTKTKTKKAKESKPVTLAVRPSWIVGVGAGASVYEGDLFNGMETAKFQQLPRLGKSYTLSVTYPFHRLLFFDFHFSQVGLYGTSADKGNLIRQKRRTGKDLEFRSTNYDAIISARVNILEFLPQTRFSPYVMGGFGALVFNPQGKMNDEWVDLRPLRTEGVSYNNLAFIAPVGTGFSLKITPRIWFDASFMWRLAFTDYIDDVSSGTIKADDLSPNGLAYQQQYYDADLIQEGFQRTKKNRGDSYATTNLKLVYLFGSKFEFD